MQSPKCRAAQARRLGIESGNWCYLDMRECKGEWMGSCR